MLISILLLVLAVALLGAAMYNAGIDYHGGALDWTIFLTSVFAIGAFINFVREVLRAFIL